MNENEQMFVMLYENTLLSKKSKEPFAKLRDDLRVPCFKTIWRYVIEKILHLTPEEALKYLNKEVLYDVKLDKTFSLLDETFDNYVANNSKYLNIVYPDKIAYNLKIETINIYSRVVKGEIFTNKVGIKVPNSFWLDNDGRKRAIYVLEYLINKYLSYMTIEEKYHFFGCKKGIAFLNKWHIKGALTKNYTSVLDYFQETAEYMNEASGLLYWNEKIKETMAI